MEKRNYIIGDVNLAEGEHTFGYAVSIYCDNERIVECSVKQGEIYRDNHGFYLQPEHQASAVSGELLKYKGDVFGASQGKILDKALKAYWGI